MTSQNRIEDVFSTRGANWGLRGDPLLWQMLKDRVSARGLPDTVDAFEAQIAADFADIVGASALSGDDFVGVRELRRANGGMSNGMVAPKQWRTVLIPLLASRFRGDTP